MNPVDSSVAEIIGCDARHGQAAEARRHHSRGFRVRV